MPQPRALLFEDETHYDLQPLTLTRPVYDLRVGITTLYEKWARIADQEPARLCEAVLQPLHGRLDKDPQQDYTCYNGKFVPTLAFVQELAQQLAEDDNPRLALATPEGELLVFRATGTDLAKLEGLPTIERLATICDIKRFTPQANVLAVRKLVDIFQLNRQVLQLDFAQLTEGRSSAGIQDKHTVVYRPENVFVEAGARIKAAIINAEEGPIYIGKAASIEEGAIIRGGHAILAHAVVNTGAKLRGDSTIGPWSKVGGELSNSVIWGYSNKAHDGFVGNSVIAQWCNLGADTNTSNLKNNYGPVRQYNYRSGRMEDTGALFCGLVMADHAKCGINTMFNTGTVVGLMANVFGGGFPPKHVGSFAWGGHDGSLLELDKGLETARRVLARRKKELSAAEEALLRARYEELGG